MGMSLADWLALIGALFGSGGLFAAVIVLVRIAIAAERRRADDWRTAAQTTAAANKVMSANIDKLVVTAEQLAATQRDMMALLQSAVYELRRVESERRDAA